MLNFKIGKITYSKPQPILKGLVLKVLKDLLTQENKIEKEIKPNLLAPLDSKKRLALYLVSCVECAKYVPNLASAPCLPKQELKPSISIGFLHIFSK